MRKILLLCFLLIPILSFAQEKLQIAVAGLNHGHVGWVLDAHRKGTIEIIGISESNSELANRLMGDFGIPDDSLYPSLEEMLENIEPEAITAFGDTYSHLDVVKQAAPKGIHVMVEKPLAVSLEHALEMERLAQDNNILLLTNYETSWYPSNHKAKELFESDQIGEIRKVVVRDGHRGPKKIGVSDEFLEWLTDPKLNGGGSLTDFGCYGANLMTWLSNGERPLAVTAITQQLQPENNPKVEDEATIIVQYPDAQLIIQASWNWPIGRKDMEVYGLTGAIFSDNRNQLRVRMAEGYDGFDETVYDLPELDNPYRDPFLFLDAAVKGGLDIPEYDVYSLENNMIVMEILDAARRSAETNQTIFLKDK